MTEALFRQEVIEEGRQRLAGTVMVAAPPSARIYTIIISTVAVCLLLALTFGSYASTASVRGVVAYDNGVARVYPRTAGEVREIYVRPGQHVSAGQQLLRLSLAQGERGLSAQLDELDKQITEIDRQLSLATASEKSSSGAISEQRSVMTQTITSLQRQQVIAEAQVKLAQSAVDRNVRLAKQGAGTQRQVEDARADLLAKRGEAEVLGERIITARGTVADLTAKLSQGGLDAGKARSQLLAQRAALANQRDEIQRSDNIVLTAPVDGEVGDLTVEIGRHVTADQSVVSVLPKASSMEVWLYAPSRAIGFAKPGQRVRLRFDAFPFEKYGSGGGVVREISPVAVDPATVDPSLEIKEPVFRVRVALTSTIPAAQATVRPGMSLSADLVLARRPLWALLFGPLVGKMGP
ncbi:MAG: HlyD family secretion protein [Sphingomonas sp.]|uniref:HlyD family secretion protein n=1 Tax=Sphingomonas sp. TaxID=28214 RepID=UPI003F7F96AF